MGVFGLEQNGHYSWMCGGTSCWQEYDDDVICECKSKSWTYSSIVFIEFVLNSDHLGPSHYTRRGPTTLLLVTISEIGVERFFHGWLCVLCSHLSP